MRLARLLFFILLPVLFYAQDPELQQHIVQPGETAFGIARQYGMTVDAFYELNPETIDVLKDGDRVLVYIPKATVPIDSSRFHFHTVKQGETIYSLTRQYDVTENILFETNPGLQESGLRVDEVIRIPKAPRRSPIKESLSSDEQQPVTSNTNSNYIEHEVQAGETLYSLTRRYNITASEMISLNPELSDGLKVGQRLKITRRQMTFKNEQMQAMTTATDSTRQPFTLYRIKEGDKLSDILSAFDITYEDLERFNPRLQEGLKPGRMLLVPLRPTKDESVKRDTSLYSLDRVYPKGKIVRIALFLPLDMERDDMDEQGNHKWVEDNEVSLSFYAGVKLALDSLMGNGVRSEVWVFSDKSISKDIIAGMDSMDIVIGPIFQKELKKLQRALSKQDINVPMVSPLSLEQNILQIPNVYQCLPSAEVQVEAIAKYINRRHPGKRVLLLHQSDNVYADRAKGFIHNLNDTNTISMKGDISDDVLDAYFDELGDSTEQLVVVLGSSQTYIANVVNTLASRRNENIRLFSESELVKMPTVELKKLGRLQLVRPENYFINIEHHGLSDFMASHKRTFNREANRFAMQGFDVTWYFINEIIGNNIEQEPLQQYFRFSQTPSGSFENVQRVWIELDRNLNQRVIYPRL